MKTVLKYYFRFWPLILIVIGLLFAQAYFDLMLPEYMAKILSDGIRKGKVALIWQYGGIMLGYSAAVVAASIVSGYLSAFIGAGMARDIRRDLFAKVMDFSGAEYDKLSVSTLITRSTNDITQFQMFAIMFTRIALYAPIMAVGGVLKAVKMSAGINSLVWIIVIAIGVLLVAILILLIFVQPKFIKLQKMNDKINLLAREGLNGMMVIRAFNNIKREEERFEGGNAELTGISLFVNRSLAFLFPIIDIVMFGVMAAVVWVTAVFAANTTGVMNMGAFIQYSMQIIMSFMMIVMVIMMMPRAVVSAKRIGEVLDTEISIKDAPNAAKLERRPKGTVEFKDVSFAYPGSEGYVLRNVGITVTPGEFTAIIGSTGSGKSTITSLIPRLYDVTEGEILLDGVNIKNIALKDLRDNIAYVPQKNVLFSGTIESNIKYADPDASDERMRAAAEIAQSTDFIEEKENGFKNEIAQDGSNVSGGQKQRLAIARALIKNAPVLIFDDSFSALDFRTDAKVREAIGRNIKDTAILVVAQRVGTIMNADKILVLENGRLAGQGTHKELLETCAVYKEIAYSQLSEDELKHE